MCPSSLGTRIVAMAALPMLVANTAQANSNAPTTNSVTEGRPLAALYCARDSTRQAQDSQPYQVYSVASPGEFERLRLTAPSGAASMQVVPAPQAKEPGLCVWVSGSTSDMLPVLAIGQLTNAGRSTHVMRLQSAPASPSSSLSGYTVLPTSIVTVPRQRTPTNDPVEPARVLVAESPFGVARLTAAEIAPPRR